MSIEISRGLIDVDNFLLIRMSFIFSIDLQTLLPDKEALVKWLKKRRSFAFLTLNGFSASKSSINDPIYLALHYVAG